MRYETLEENIKWAQLSFLKNINYEFPDEHMGVGDKLILRNVVKERVTNFLNHSPESSTACAYFLLDVRVEMENV